MIDINVKQKENVAVRPKEDLKEKITEGIIMGDRTGRITAQDALFGLFLELIYDAALFYINNNRIPGIKEVFSAKLNRYQNDLFQQMFNDLFLPRIVHQLDDVAIRAGIKLHTSGIMDKIKSMIHSKQGYDEKKAEYRKRFRYHKLIPPIYSEILSEYDDISFPEKKIIFRKSPQTIYVKKTLHNKRNLFVNKK